MIFVGIDWAEEHHDVCIVDVQGVVLWRHRIGHDPAGVRSLREATAALEPDPAQVMIGIETGRGLLVSELVAAGYVIFPINPKAAERFRDRRALSGRKDDRLDAEVLAQAVRSDRASLRVLLPDSPEALEIATLARDHANLTRQQIRLRNQLRSALQEYFPASVRAFSLEARSALVFLTRYAEPEAAARLSVGQVARFLRTQRANRNADAKAQTIVDLLRAPALRARPEVARAKARLVRTLCAQLLSLHPAMQAYERELADLLKRHPEGEIFLSFPGLGVVLASRVLAATGDNPERFASGYGPYAGTAPIVVQSGKRRVVKARVAAPKYFRDAAQQWAEQARRWSPWAGAYYARHRARGHSHNESTRALADQLLRQLFDLRRLGTKYDEAVHLANVERAAAHAA
ncbi:MAG: IS110 family transposase [Chloroflexota bacterium]|nr:IS110 family transposase [Chloroflexota bacterium]